MKKRKIGKVVSDKPDKTILVEVERIVKHPFYKKYIKTRKKFMVHDDKNQAKLGDIVEIVEVRPFSKNKRWRLVKIIEKSEGEL
ncbi:30S ribosomal protein S17 [candidate division WOR-3 bacterium]|nr:30S ribosomal protein S17 [candidate division WOR-3 bacterium]